MSAIARLDRQAFRRMDGNMPKLDAEDSSGQFSSLTPIFTKFLLISIRPLSYIFIITLLPAGIFSANVITVLTEAIERSIPTDIDLSGKGTPLIST